MSDLGNFGGKTRRGRRAAGFRHFVQCNESWTKKSTAIAITGAVSPDDIVNIRNSGSGGILIPGGVGTRGGDDATGPRLLMRAQRRQPQRAEHLGHFFFRNFARFRGSFIFRTPQGRLHSLSLLRLVILFFLFQAASK